MYDAHNHYLHRSVYVMHHYYYNPLTLDLSVIQKQARSIANPKLREPEESIIHHHPHKAPCRGSIHEFFAPADVSPEEMAARFWEAVDEAEEMETVR
jgi:hypothetical protein